MLRAIARYCSFRGLETISADELERVIAPASLTAADSAQSSGTIWHDSLELAIEYGLVTRDDDVLALSPNLAELAAPDRRDFRRALRAEVLAAQNNDGLWDEGPKGLWPSLGSREFSRIAVWVLEQKPTDVLNSPEGAYVLARRQVERESEKLVENPEQWNVFCRWGAALGLMAPLADIHLPDAAVAIEDELANLLKPDEMRPAIDVRDELLRRIPVLRGGSLAEGLARFVKSPPKAGDVDSGPAITLALRTLERGGKLRFHHVSDARPLPLGRPEGKNPTHIQWLGET